jgi:hypothetical protein
MKTAATILISLFVGVLLGWHSYRARASAKYLRLMETAGITEQEMVEAYKKIPAMMDNMESEDRMAAVVSLAALRMLESNNVAEAKHLLAQQPASYYVVYGPPDNPGKKMTEDRRSTLEAIQKARRQSSALDEAIAASMKNVEE